MQKNIRLQNNAGRCGLNMSLKVGTASSEADGIKKIAKKSAKIRLLFIFLSILYMQAKERTNRAGRIGESGDCSLWILAYVTGIFLRWRLPDAALCGGTAGEVQT